MREDLTTIAFAVGNRMALTSIDSPRKLRRILINYEPKKEKVVTYNRHEILVAQPGQKFVGEEDPKLLRACPNQSLFPITALGVAMIIVFGVDEFEVGGIGRSDSQRLHGWPRHDEKGILTPGQADLLLLVL